MDNACTIATNNSSAPGDLGFDDMQPGFVDSSSNVSILLCSLWLLDKYEPHRAEQLYRLFNHQEYCMPPGPQDQERFEGRLLSSGHLSAERTARERLRSGLAIESILESLHRHYAICSFSCAGSDGVYGRQNYGHPGFLDPSVVYRDSSTALAFMDLKRARENWLLGKRANWNTKVEWVDIFRGKLKISLREAAANLIEGEVDTFSSWLKSETYGYVVEDETENVVESCWGYYGLEETGEGGQIQKDAQSAAERWADGLDSPVAKKKNKNEDAKSQEIQQGGIQGEEQMGGGA